MTVVTVASFLKRILQCGDMLSFSLMVIHDGG